MTYPQNPILTIQAPILKESQKGLAMDFGMKDGRV